MRLLKRSKLFFIVGAFIFAATFLPPKTLARDPNGVTRSPFDPVNYVDPFIGTMGSGNVFAGASLPMGFIQPGPDTGWGSGASGYKKSSPINGFSQQHISGLGGPLYGEFSIMPVVGEIDEPSHVISAGKSFEAACPGYYTVTLSPSNVKVELTCTQHVAFYRETFPLGKKSQIVVNVGHCLFGKSGTWNSAGPVNGEVQIDAKQQEVTGYMTYRGGRSTTIPWTAYFVARFDKPIVDFVPWKDDVWATPRTASVKGANIGAKLQFEPDNAGIVQVKIAVSWRSIEQATWRVLLI